MNLALEAGREVLPGVFKDTWEQVKQLLGFTTDPAHEDLALTIAKRVEGNDALARQILTEIRAIAAHPKAPASTVTVRLLGGVQVTNGHVQAGITIHGGQTNNFHFAPPKPSRN
ncbi:MAG: hypothetical protein H7210_02075 [Pyrinomonadaceae bacterium]|nr:hypothetical protein [Phycisphaerales bacterium]